MLRLLCECIRRSAFLRGTRGNAVVEFAFVGTALLVAIFGLVEFGRYVWEKHSLEYAIEQSARSVMAQTSVSNSSVQSDVLSRIIGIDPTTVTATVTQSTVGTVTFVTITLSYTHNFLATGLLGLNAVTIVASTRVPLTPSN